MEWLIQLPILFFSVIVHEVAHGYTAYRNGDDTAYLMGRLNFNPMAHFDLFGTLVVPLMCRLSGLPMIGWAKPVPVNPVRLRNMRKGMMQVSAAGPLSNIVMAFVFAVLLNIILFAGQKIDINSSLGLIRAFGYGVIINLALAFFNLTPVPPLDGSHILAGLLPRKYAEIYGRIAPYGMWILLGLVFTGLIKYLIFPPVILVLKLFSLIGLQVPAI